MAQEELHLVRRDVLSGDFDVYGLLHDGKRFLRMPQEVAAAANSGVASNNLHTAGGRVRFTTDSQHIEIRVKMSKITHFNHMPLTGTSGFDLYEDYEEEIGGGSRYLATFKPDYNMTEGYTSVVSLGNLGAAHERHFTINFPLYNGVDSLEIGLDEGASLSGGLRYLPVLPVVYYGSSITQGGCASRPGLCYQNRISRRLNIDHVNLGFSGSARGEQVVADYIAGLKMSAFVLDYDHNAPNVEHLRATHKNFYDTVRAKHPEIPIILASRPNFDVLTPETREEVIARRRVVQDTYLAARQAGDKNVYYIDGEGFFRGVEADSCTVDGCHPNDIGFLKMADCFGRILRRALRQGFASSEEE